MAHLLFEQALQTCNKQHKGAFMEKFFGTNIKEVKHSTVAKPRTMNKTPPNQTKPKQTTLGNFMFDGFIVKTIEKKQRAKKTAKAKEEEAKNEIVVPR